MRFFLTGVRDVARQATDTAKAIQHLREEHRALVGERVVGTPTGLVLLDKLFEQPVINVNQVAAAVERSYPAANELVTKFVDLGILREVTGQRRNRIYTYGPYVDLVAAPAVNYK